MADWSVVSGSSSVVRLAGRKGASSPQHASLDRRTSYPLLREERAARYAGPGEEASATRRASFNVAHSIQTKEPPLSLASMSLTNTDQSNVQTIGLDLRFRGRCDHAKGTVDLSRYPSLTYAPAQWGEGVRTATTGVSIAFIANAARAEDGSDGLVGQIDDLAKLLQISFDELLDALRYARAAGKV